MKPLFRQAQQALLKPLPKLYFSPKTVNVDTMAIFSASQRTNKGRKRHRHGGLTASIYLSDHIDEGRQIGSMYQTITWKQGPVVLRSIPMQNLQTLHPILNEYIPHNQPVFSDMAYKWYTNRNHKMINHSARSKDKRYRFAKHRWSKDGVHIQAAEGIQGSFKTAMRTYRYYKPEYSQLYADEWSFLHNIRFFGWDKTKRALKDVPIVEQRSQLATFGHQELL